MAKKLLITVIVLSVFQDKFDHKTQYPEGTELQVDKERADDLVSRGLAKIKEVESPKEVIKEKKEAKEKKAKEAVEAAVLSASPADENLETKQEDGQQGTEKQ
ncbi:hypothetical protein [Bacteroides oleiciplenus]|uniref:Uncharacterized protein n=1 Tax=Bacteroides oleiciplenus TaxID=626931 RepID=A0A3E5B8J9_9BACE|nr:hypothetical protein [Bacteroides oleiciplenus]RGN33864.1 hypothetical protein DXB65_15405 [Bacteroides oleiciplenus]